MDKSERYVRELLGEWDGMRLVVSYRLDKESSTDGEITLILYDDINEAEEILGMYRATALWTGETGDGLFIFELKIKYLARSTALVHEAGVRGGIASYFPKTNVYKREISMLASFEKLAAWFLIERGAGLVKANNCEFAVDDEQITSIKRSLGEPKQERFFEEGRAQMLQGLAIEIDEPADWETKGYGEITVSIVSQAGVEGCLEGRLRKMAYEPLSLNIQRIEITPRSSEPPTKKDQITAEAQSIRGNMRKALLFLTARYLRGRYGEPLIYEGVDNLPDRITLVWEEIEGLTDLWLRL